MKFIHCSDLHLDSRLETNLSHEQAVERNTEICATFSKMLTYASENGVTAVMICGDLFDTERISATTVDFVLSAITKNPQVDVLYLRGNHDESRRAFAGRNLPDNLKTFSEKWTYYSYDSGKVTIAGAELNDSNYATIGEELAFPDDGGIHIVMMHGQVSSQPGKDNVCLEQLSNKDIHYLALGHLHSYQKNRLGMTGEYCYCGSLEGRGFDECGEKGFVLLETKKSSVYSEFIPFASRTIYNISVDITGLLTNSQIQDAMDVAAEAAGASSDSLVRFTLIGACTLETQKDLKFLEHLEKDRFYTVQVKDESKLQITPETYEFDISLKGEFIRQVMKEDLSDEDRESIITYGLKALKGEDIS